MEFLTQYLPIINSVFQILGGLCLLATIIAWVTPTPKDDAIVDALNGYFYKVLHFLPTLGINPLTAKLQAALEEAQQKLKDKPIPPPK